MQKVINIASLVGCSLAVALTGGAVYGYFWATNPETQEKIKEQVIESVMQNIPIPGGLTGPALPTKDPAKRGATPGLRF